jgi:hypothetical protein
MYLIPLNFTFKNEESIMKFTKYGLKMGEEERGLRECNRGSKLVQGLMYTSMEISQGNLLCY